MPESKRLLYACWGLHFSIRNKHVMDLLGIEQKDLLFYRRDHVIIKHRELKTKKGNRRMEREREFKNKTN